MEEAEILKVKANQLFAEGDVYGAIRLYNETLNLLEDPIETVNELYSRKPRDYSSKPKSPSPIDEFKSIIYSNLSHAYLVLKDFEESWTMAEIAMAFNEEAIKPVLRFIEAKLQGGYSFEAFVAALLRARPLVRMETEAQTEKERHPANSGGALQTNPNHNASMNHILLKSIEKKLQDELGLSELSPGIELVPFMGGVTLVSRQSFSPGDVVFIEKKYPTPIEADLEIFADTVYGTKEIALHFAMLLSREQATESVAWRRLQKDFCGVWPRALEEVCEEVEAKVSGHLRAHLRPTSESAFRELLVMALRCRYNCFHTGFFRGCALANHGCRANLAMKYDASRGVVTMRAVDHVAPGDALLVKYLDDVNFLFGVAHRRELLRAWGFWCDCARCVRDCDPATALHEFITCQACGAFTHHPYSPLSARPADERHEVMAQEAAFSVGSCCRHCGARVEWGVERTNTLLELLAPFVEECSARSLSWWLSGRLEKARTLRVFPTSWVYRLVFYLYTHYISGIIDEFWTFFQTLRHPMKAPALIMVMQVFTPCGLQNFYSPLLDEVRENPLFNKLMNDSDSEEGKYYRGLLDESGEGMGCETLRVLLIFWHLIASFYPSQELWEVHRMICIFVLLHLIFQENLAHVEAKEQLTDENALKLLQRHGAYLEFKEIKRWLNLYQTLKPHTNVKHSPSMGAVKKAFKLK
ncbi:unnamed protein product [Phytomonas sp. Hart1]|nr:unnamed protein product [Phytomonas sp. Hart1]|eukprot:CCW66079.1 unnamed protein product [Phytomonas sp. isolate Hart1]